MNRTSITLVAIALGLLGFILLFERGSVTTTEREVRKGRVLERFVRDRVTRIEVQRHGVTTVLVHVPPNEKDPLDLGGWEVQSPYEAKADSAEVDSLLGALEWAESRRSLGAASREDLAKFGLDAPRYRVRYKVSREEVSFSVGAEAADGSGVYLKLGDSDSVYVVGRELLEALAREPNDYHAKSLHEGLTVLTLESLVLRASDGQERKIVKRDGFFWIESPINTLVSGLELKGFIDVVDALRASRYVGEKALPEHELSPARLSLQLDSLVYDAAHKGQRKTERFSLRVGAPCAGHAQELYIQVGEGAVYCASKPELDKLDRSADSFRELRVLPLDDDEIAGVILSDSVRELTLETRDNVTRFKLTQAGTELSSGTADAEAVKRWYGALRDSKLSLAPSGDEARRAAAAQGGGRATFQRAGKDAAAYVINLERSTRTLLTRLNEPSLFEVPERTSVLLAPVAARFHALRVLSEDEGQLRSLVVTRAGGESERVERTAAGYDVVSPLKATAARAAVDELVRLLSGLEAVSYESDEVRPEHGLASSQLSVRTEYSPDPADNAKAREHTLRIGAKQRDTGWYARLDDDNAVFVVAGPLVSKLQEPLLARNLVGLPVGRTRKLALTVGARQWAGALDSEGRQGQLEGKRPDVSAAVAGKLVSLLESLRAQGVRAYAAPAAAGPARFELTAQLNEPEESLRYTFLDHPDGPEAGVLLRRSDMAVTWVVSKADFEVLWSALPPDFTAQGKTRSAR